VVSGLRIVADVSVADTEVKRRGAVRVTGGLRHLDTLRFLLTLPLNEAIPVARFSSYEKQLVGRATRALFGAETRTNEDERLFTRTAQPPLHVNLVSVHGPATRRTLRLTTSFAPYAARRIITTRRVDEAFAIEAQYYGVGITTLDNDGAHLTASPAPFLPSRFTGASWLFAEHAYEHLTGETQALSATPAIARA
jgi:hypothetical protein